jgi:hypothetical protein
MGARCTFVFKQSEDLGVALYSHWGEYDMYTDLAQALQHAAPRKGDKEYYTRMAISYLLKDSILDETGFGIYACNPNDLGFMDHPILIDLTNNTISHDDVNHKDIDSFINYNLPDPIAVDAGIPTAGVGVTLR